MKLIKPFISIIIASYNGEKYLPTCLKSVLLTKYSNFEVILVDDGSRDKSIEIIDKFRRKNKKVSLLKNEINIGAAASRNKAAKIAKGEILVFLDNDTEVSPLWILEMVKTLSKDKKIGGCQALLMDFQKRDRIQVAGTKIWAATGWGLPIGQWEENKGQYNFEEDIIGISAALAVWKKVYEKIGGFDELEFVVTEDLDLCWRIWISGYRVVRSYKSIVYHWTKPISMRKNMNHTKEKIYFHLVKNSLISISKNYELRNSIRFVIYSFFISLGRAIAIFLKKKDTSSLKGTLNAFFWYIGRFDVILKSRKFVQQNRVWDDAKLFDIILLRKSFLKVYLTYYNQTKQL